MCKPMQKHTQRDICSVSSGFQLKVNRAQTCKHVAFKYRHTSGLSGENDTTQHPYKQMLYLSEVGGGDRVTCHPWNSHLSSCGVKNMSTCGVHSDDHDKIIWNNVKIVWPSLWTRLAWYSLTCRGIILSCQPPTLLLLPSKHTHAQWACISSIITLEGTWPLFPG